MVRFVGLFLALAAMASAEFMAPTDVPVDRLLANTAAYVRENPNDPQGYYVLARINALAYVSRSGKLPSYGEGSETKLPGTELPYGGRWRDAGAVGDGGGPSAPYLKDSLRNFGKAVSMEPKNGLFRLGLAYILEKGAPDASELPPGIEVPKPTEEEAREMEALAGQPGDAAREKLISLGARGAAAVLPRLQDGNPEVRAGARKVLSRFWADRSFAEYVEAFRLSSSSDGKLNHRPLRGIEGLVSHESGQSILRRLQAKTPSDEEKRLAGEVREHLKKLEGLPHGPITPVIFSPDGAGSVRDLLAGGVTAGFDLDGDGAVERWPWVRPDTVFLAWDPAGTGKIASGRQLFGSVTWWMFWNDGYHALDALDDDRDGWLSGSELRGISGWQDRDSNGRSDPGEVVPVTALGVEAVRARATHLDGACPASAGGLRLRDGRLVNTFDWVTEPVRPAAP
jgi:hypothetical protein